MPRVSATAPQSDKLAKTAAAPSRRPTYPWLYALPHGTLPAGVTCEGRRYTLLEVFKHDFFAATGLYRGPRGERVVLKLGRQTPFLTIPMRWLGEFLTRREVRMYAKLQGTAGIPRLVGILSSGAGFLHDFVPGHPLGRDERVSDRFFDELLTMVRGLHERHIAYVDLNKRQNVLVGDDGRPYLIDFQISLDIPPSGWGRFPPLRWLLARFQHGDWYHCLKHKRRLRPDLLTDEERAEVEALSPWIRLHRVVSRPFTNMRRTALQRLKKSEAMEVVGSAAK
jgi:hypothetical protein